MSGYQSVFARVEKKFFLDEIQCEKISDALRAQSFDRPVFGSATIQSIYYDTADCLLARRSIARPPYKEKLRLRAYGTPDRDARAYVEIKKKAAGIVYKRRTGLPLAEAVAALSRGSMPASCGQIGQEIDWFIHLYCGLRPSALIAYERDAWEKPAEGIRVTFDRDIRFRAGDFDLTHRPVGTRLVPEGRILMEVKVPGAYPLWLTDLIWSVGAKPVHFSKYGTAYADFIRGGAMSALPQQQDTLNKRIMEVLRSA